eukprot:701564-Rhodomonas_salina.1
MDRIETMPSPKQMPIHAKNGPLFPSPGIPHTREPPHSKSPLRLRGIAFDFAVSAQSEGSQTSSLKPYAPPRGLPSPPPASAPVAKHRMIVTVARNKRRRRRYAEGEGQRETR